MQNSWILFKGKVGRESVIFAVPGKDKETITAFRSFLKQKGGCPGNIAVAVCDMSKALNITQIVNILMNPLYPALERLPFSGFQSSLIADRRGSAIRPAIETLQKANRSCGRGHGRQPFTGRGYFFERFNGSPP